ncbi:unnamed protein product [Mytilus edulis]|uniref:Uncharacterized protein n=1 Tax=Mytilus edulis TaxID=6550 RepID=A0A8S3RF91_MYTED|nr:unnamed protein product [Mytilus edulis]
MPYMYVSPAGNILQRKDCRTDNTNLSVSVVVVIIESIVQIPGPPPYTIITGKVVKIYRGNETEIPIGSSIQFTAHEDACVPAWRQTKYILSGTLGTLLDGHYDITLCHSIIFQIGEISITLLRWIENVFKKLKSIGCKGKHHCLALPDIPKNKDVKNACLFPVTPTNATDCYIKWGVCLRTKCNDPCTWFYAEGSNCAEGDYEPDVVPPVAG